LKKQPGLDAEEKAARVWNAAPAGATHARDLEPGTLTFFQTALNRRTEHEVPWLPETIAFESTAGKRVLELGCGAGFDAYNFCRFGADYTGIDIAPENPLRTLRHLDFFGYIPKVVQTRIHSLPFPDESFEIVYSCGVLHHLLDIHGGLREARRVLEPGGNLWILVYHKNSIFHWITLFLVDHIYKRGFRQQSFAARLAEIEYTTSNERPVVNVYSRRQLRKILVDTGFAVESIQARKLVAQDLPSLPLLDKVWPRIPQSWLDRVGMLLGWYLVAKAKRI
jgi:ubiquinone/menaquinone biosynthesis C-methylase UbiE